MFWVWSTYSIDLIGLSISRIFKKPWIADFRDPMVQENYPSDPVKSRLWKWIEKKTVLNAVEKTKKAIAKIIPNVDVKVYENESDYLKVKDASKGDGGMYDGKTIHINLSNSNSSTVAHEGFHALLLNAVKNDEKLAKKISDDMLRVVQKKLPENNKLRIAIEKHAAKYKGKIQTERRSATNSRD